MSTAASGFEIREHPADVMLYVWGDTLEALFRAGADGVYAVIGDLVVLDRGETVSIRLEAPDATDLFHDWLTEVLYLFEARRVKLSDMRFPVLTETVLSAGARASAIDPARSCLDAEVKAVTYHGLHVHRTDRGFEASVILDL